ncbi:hypothetical protein A3I25_02130 [Candidatus Nomurabacteria bacterium RIFCSPLOWO2_02_FULL_42_17]|uniref:Uncharacterized protein n=1 Tax=Candidatus Nomurabacteria bacterium RIFCSPLOWO2_02_FULL_42_17 TaxID=1801789 RepID=A0A1F6XTZ4_9BACT|nr:MAG: hypothetical protein A3I25_02130 [Candidatus Nomurabacteria bacterium RIFCSPLOWO2_02_FULL_42_17]
MQEFGGISLNPEITYFARTNFRNTNKVFGIKKKDRRQHTYVIGKSGSGKSALLANMIIQDIARGEGVCVVDPHGELVESIVDAIPAERVKDVVYFNPADIDFHVGFNVLQLDDPRHKHLVASGLMGIFTKIWANTWSARMEYILNNTILALLDTPGTTMLGIPRLLVDKDYRQQIISNLKDPVIRAFWVHEYETWKDQYRNEAIAPIQNKVGQFLSTSIIRNVVGQAKSTIDIFDIMNSGKIFLVNVSKGRIGEDNSSLLGGMIITKLQLAAMERVRIPEADRRDFYLYVDEFQNFVTDSFAGILSEARKYRLDLTIAHQYVGQLVTNDSTAVRDSIFGNVGTAIMFRIGATDAEFMEKEFEPEFTPEDMVNLPNYTVYLKLMVDGVTSRPFSAVTLPPFKVPVSERTSAQIIESSRKLYCRPCGVVEEEINKWSGMLGEGLAGKFKINCSICAKESTVPFEPQKGRPVYCRDCLGKIEAGELKPIRTMREYGPEPRSFDDLAAIGIEYKPSGGGVKPELRPPQPRPVPSGAGPRPQLRPQQQPARFAPQRVSQPQPLSRSVSYATTARPVLQKDEDKKHITHPPAPYQEKPVRKTPDLVGLRGALEEALLEAQQEKSSVVAPVAPVAMPAVPLSTLKKTYSIDKGPSEKNLNELKSTLKEIITEKPATDLEDSKPTQPQDNQKPKPKTRDIPEDILRKILE